jgi:hypothetical protein
VPGNNVSRAFAANDTEPQGVFPAFIWRNLGMIGGFFNLHVATLSLFGVRVLLSCSSAYKGCAVRPVLLTPSQELIVAGLLPLLVILPLVQSLVGRHNVKNTLKVLCRALVYKNQ